MKNRKNPYYVASTKSEAKQIAAEWKRQGKSAIKIRKGPGGEEYYVHANPAKVKLRKAPKGWMKAKAVRVVRRGGQQVVEVRR